jgi:hypothetical protein
MATWKPPQKIVDAYPKGTIFACTETGSACQRTVDQLLEAEVASYGPGGVADEPGRRLLVKSDGGPAVKLDDDKWLDSWRQRGVILFCGLPNASAVNQVRVSML